MNLHYSFRKSMRWFSLLSFAAFLTLKIQAQGTWTPLKNLTPYPNGGVMVMVLLSDGTVMAKTSAKANDTIGTPYWSLLTPDSHGSYANGTWSDLASMSKNRLYFPSQVLRDGRVYIAGGENGNGQNSAEIFDPQTGSWSNLPFPGATVSDGNSALLPDGRVLQALVAGTLRGTAIFDPATNSFSSGPTCVGIHNESVWVTLPDSSILFADRGNNAPVLTSERFIPSQNKWVADANVPVYLYDQYGFETGAGFLLPDGRAFFLGSPGTTAIYTPSGNASPGSWVAGPPIPNGQGAPDAPAVMMPNGKVMLCIAPAPTAKNHFPKKTTFFEYDYLSNTFSQIKAPDGTDTLPGRTADCNMLMLPDGTVLYSNQGSSQCYVYNPGGTPLASGKPTIGNVWQNGCSFSVSGTLFNGISEGASYGDDWQMSTNRPLIRLFKDTSVYYVRAFNWNRAGVVQTGNLADTVQFSVPWTVPSGTYSLVVVANGIASDPVAFNYTYNPCVSPSAALDAGVAQISSPASATSCGSSVFAPQFLIRNFGSDTLTTCTVNYQFDSNPVQTYTWNGSLAYMQSASIAIPTMTVSAVGSHTFMASTASPNSGTDSNPANDQRQVVFNIMADTASILPPYKEGFESAGFPYADCYVSGQSSHVWTRVTSASATGTASMELDNFSLPQGDVAEFITPAINMTAAKSALLTFQVAYAEQAATGPDNLTIYISSDCGATWTQRYTKSGATLATAGTVSSAFTPSSGQWRLESVNVGLLIGKADARVKFQFNSFGKANNIFIDDINIIGDVSVAELAESNFDMAVSPNPFVETAGISFRLPDKSSVSASVYDMVGREIFPVLPNTELSAGAYTFPVSRETLTPGIYFVRLNVNGRAVTQKIIVQ